MMSREDTDLLCRVEPGTPMNQAFKRYWIIAGLSSDHPHPDSDPKRSTMMGEDYVLFRDSEGRMGCLRELCCHRGASLCLGRVEQGGIRCIYHGWKFDVSGTIVDMPNVAGDQYKQRYRQPSFPVHEKGGLIWVYLGPKDQQPPVPAYRWLDFPDHQCFVAPVVFECNFTQAVDGGADSSHLTTLHQDALSRHAESSDGDMRDRVLADAAPRFDTYETEFGQFSAAIRTTKGPDGEPVMTCRSSAFVAPSIVMVTGGRPNAGTWAFATPVSSTRTILYIGMYDDEWTSTDQRDEAMRFMTIDPASLDQLGLSRETIGRPGRIGRENNWFQDRDAMNAGRFTGMPLFVPEDVAMSESMGAIYDRGHENLVPADQAVVRIRRIMLAMAKDVRDGRDPVGLRTPLDTAAIYTTEAPIKEGEDWTAAVIPPQFLTAELEEA